MQSYLYKLVEIEEMTGRHPEAEKIAEIADDMVSFFGLWKGNSASINFFISKRYKEMYSVD